MSASTYHHGDLPAALRAATVELIAEKGPGGFSLREVARQAGVSHAAPAHHYGSAKGLLTAVAIEGFEQLLVAFEAAMASTDDPIGQLETLGKAYVNTALANPGHFAVMCNEALLEPDDKLAEISAAAYDLLLQALAGIRDSHNPSLDVDAAALMAWSTVHGLSVLQLASPLMVDAKQARPGELDDTIARFTKMVMAGHYSR